MVDAGLIYLCMADAVFAKRRAYGYLIDIRNLFIGKVLRILLLNVATRLICSFPIPGNTPLPIRWTLNFREQWAIEWYVFYLNSAFFFIIYRLELFHFRFKLG
jgi:hypothetical protein